MRRIAVQFTQELPFRPGEQTESELEAEEKMRVAKLEEQPLKRENNLLKQEMKLLQARTQKAERRAKEFADELNKVEQQEVVKRKKPGPLSPMAKMKPTKRTRRPVPQ